MLIGKKDNDDDDGDNNIREPDVIIKRATFLLIYHGFNI